MPRRGVVKVDALESKDAGFKAPIHLNKGTGEFSIEMDKDKKIVTKDLEELKTEAAKWLEENRALKWRPVIVIRPEGDRYSAREASEEEIDFSYERYFQSKRPDGSRVWKHFQNEPGAEIPEGKEMGWNDVADKGVAGCSTSEPYIANRKDSIIMPYTPERWMALRTISHMIRKLNERISKELKGGAQKFLAHIAKLGTTSLLPAPKETAEER